MSSARRAGTVITRSAAGLLASLLLAGCADTQVTSAVLQDPEGSLAPVVDADDLQTRDGIVGLVQPVRDDLAERDDLVLSAEVALPTVLALARAGASSEEGEEFALAASIYLGDDQNGEVGPEEVATLVAADRPDVAQYVHSQMGMPERVGREPARIDTSVRPWLRTEVVKRGVVRTTLALYVLYPGSFDNSDGIWAYYSSESRHRDGVWQLTHWDNVAGPWSRTLSEQERGTWPGSSQDWRRIRFG